ncbi:MAG TPA: (deoxy)nucleoside triphosphate pyrophosphohydrolase [Polyangiaceae bacterium]|nr:(deoxy)nucleoside triphosphate pyrophosphohydrolase [Polyangiaceae bacterium]
MSNHETTLHVVGAAIVQGQKCLVTQRGPAMTLAGKWEFPGGKVEPGESASAALAREISEELNLTIAVGELLGTGRAMVGPKEITLDVYGAVITSGSLVLREHSQALWVEADALAAFDWADADVPSVPHVVAWLRRQGS